MAEEERKRYAEEQNRRRREEAKARVQEYQMQKAVNARMEKAQKELEERNRRARVDGAELLRLHERDKDIVNKRTAHARERKREERDKEARLDRLRSQVVVRTDRDPSRLYRPTEGVRNRLKSQDGDRSAMGRLGEGVRGAKGEALTVRRPATGGRLATPSWRAGTTHR